MFSSINLVRICSFVQKNECRPDFRASQVALLVKNPPANAGDITDAGLIPRLGRYLEEGMATHSIIFLPGEFRGQRNLTGYSP